MGKRIITQRRGRGTSTYRNFNKHSCKTSFSVYGKEGCIKGKIVDILHSKSHSAPIMKIKYENGVEAFLPAYEGAYIGKDFIVFHDVNKDISVSVGNAYPIGMLQEGTLIYSIEATPGDSSRLVKAGGVFARVVSHNKGKTKILLPSKKEKILNSKCRAIVGEIGGAGRTEKPFLKAGLKAKFMAKTNKLYPRVSGVAMSAFDHPFGSTRSLRKGRPTIAPANAPPGRKVGMIRPRHTGRNR